MKLELFSRTVMAVVLVALGITLGVWLTHAPLTAAPAKAPPEPTLAPSPPVMPTVIEVPVEVEIADMNEPLAANPAEPEPESRPAFRPRRSLFRRH